MFWDLSKKQNKLEEITNQIFKGCQMQHEYYISQNTFSKVMLLFTVVIKSNILLIDKNKQWLR